MFGTSARIMPSFGDDHGGSSPSAMMRNSPSVKQLRRSLTQRESEIRRRIQCLDGSHPGDDDMLFQMEAEGTQMMRGPLGKGVAFERTFTRAATVRLDRVELPTRQGMLTPEEKLSIAACFVQHAVLRKPISSIHWQSPVSRALFRLQQTQSYRLALRVAFLGLALVILWEPPVTGIGEAPPPRWEASSVVEIVCALGFVADLCCQLVCRRPRRFITSSSSCIYALLVVPIAADALSAPIAVAASGVYPFRFSRLLRPLLLPFLWRTCEHMVVSILRSLPSFSDFILLIFVTLVFFTLLGLSFFGRDPSDLAAANATTGAIFLLGPDWRPPNATIASSPVTDLLRQPLSSMPVLALHLTIALFSADNYPHILYASFSCTELACGPAAGSLFFLVFVVLGHIILMTVSIAIVFETYKRQHACVILSERVSERVALLAAFHLLATSEGGRQPLFPVDTAPACAEPPRGARLDKARFGELLRAVRPRTNQETVKLAFRILDSDGSDDIDAHEFVQAASVLMVRVTRAAMSEACPCSTWRSERLGRLVENPCFLLLCDMSTVAYIILLLVFSSGVRWSASEASVFLMLDLAFVCYFTIELVAKVIGLSFEAFWADVSNRIDLIVVPLCWLTYALEGVLQTPGSGSSVRALRLLRLLRVGRAMGRLVKVFGKVITSTRKTKVFMITMMRFGRVVLPMVGVLLVLVYLFAVLGMELLANALDPNISASLGDDCAPYCPSFASVTLAWLTLFQMLIGANWSPILVEAVARNGSFGPVAYFLSFIAICHVLMLSSLLVALMLEVYSCEMEKAARASSEDKMSIVWEDIEPPPPVAVTSQLVLFSVVRDKFEQYDVNPKNGRLDSHEVAALLRDLSNGSLTDNEIEVAKAQIDLDGSGEVELDEFMPWWRRYGIRKVFERHDADESGSIDAKELSGIMVELGVQLSDERRDEVLKQLDVDSSGTISFEEYLRWFELHDLQSEFDTYDEDGSGTINKREFVKLTQSLGLNLTRKESDFIFSKLDADGNASITFDEVCASN